MQLQAAPIVSGDPLGSCVAAAVFRQKCIVPYAGGTCSAKKLLAATMGRIPVSALAGRPVLVVADREKHPMLLDEASPAIRVDVGEVADVVAVALEPANGRILVGEHPVGIAIVVGEGPIVADFGAFAIDRLIGIGT